MRGLAAALTVPVLLFTGVACGSDDKAPDAKVEVSGGFGEKPTIKAPKDAKFGKDPVTETLTEGSGPEVKKGDFVRVDYAGHTVKDGKDVVSSWVPQSGTPAPGPRQQTISQPGKPGTGLPPDKVVDTLVGKKAGSRVLVKGTASALLGEQVVQRAGLEPNDGMVWVVDVVAAKAVDAKAEAKGEQAAVEDGMPEVKAEPQKAATITVPKGEKPPTELKQQVLIKGDGPKVEAGQGLIAQYTGVKWEDGQKFDSSWDHGGATAFQIGTSSVVKGWDQALVGKNIGDRVLLVIPPDLAYGGSPEHQLAKNTLVFVVDILGTV
ncbi:FKBP-type peptidyl-prolyl cis-trans isomerase [Streptomyces sp. URMC 123]|uniref:FKBP-type peptidyl-prolyl cis-trans isomerase n=1 Tax=Streptomyces sp. URMC 123 TaxID=3423403 RepID=UPI003F1B8DEB